MPVMSDARIVPGAISHERLSAFACPNVSTPASAAACAAEARETRRDEDEDEPREPEEPREVDPDAALVDAVAQGSRHQDPEDRPGPGRPGVQGVLEGRDQEDRGLQALADHREERQAHERPG